MNRIFALIFLLFWKTSFSAIYPAVNVADDPAGVLHLPKKLRASALEFYPKMREEMQKITGQVIPDNTPHTLLVHMYGTQDWNGHDKPCHRFLDYCIRTDGITIKPNTPAALPERDGTPYALEDLLADGAAAPTHDNYVEFRETFFDVFQTLAYRHNAFASFFLGALHLGYLGGTDTNHDAGYHWLLVAANKDYKRAIDFLITHHDPQFPEMISLDMLSLKESLLRNSLEKLEGLITHLDPVARAIPNSTLDLLAQSLSYQGKRIESLTRFYEQLTPIIGDILAASKRRRFDGRKLVRDLIHDSIVYAIPAVLITNFLSDEGTLNITSYGEDLFEYKLMGYETYAGATWGLGRFLYNIAPLASKSACRLFCRGTIDPSVGEETIVSESRLSALYITLCLKERIRDALAPLRPADLSTPLKNLFAKHLKGTSKPMSQVIFENFAMLQ